MWIDQGKRRTGDFLLIQAQGRCDSLHQHRLAGAQRAVQQDNLATGKFSTETFAERKRFRLSDSQSETFALGERLGAELAGGEIILLNGPLGAGKTMLVKGIATALGLDQEEVTSPSFTLVNPHRGRLL